MTAEIVRIKAPEGSGWGVHGPHGAQRYKDGPDGYLVRLADVVRWLMQDRKTTFAGAVREVCGPLEGDDPPLLFRLDRVDDATPENEPSEWFELLEGDYGLHMVPPQVAYARLAARDMRAAWLMKPNDLARLVNSPGHIEYREGDESPFEFSERTDRVGGPCTLAVPFAVAHALWGWGAVVDEAPASPFPLADWRALVAYRKANPGSDWGLGNQVAVGKTELGRRVKGGKTESDALAEMALDVGLKTRQAMHNAMFRERMRAKKKERAATAQPVTHVRDGKRQPKVA